MYGQGGIWFLLFIECYTLNDGLFVRYNVTRLRDSTKMLIYLRINDFCFQSSRWDASSLIPLIPSCCHLRISYSLFYKILDNEKEKGWLPCLRVSFVGLEDKYSRPSPSPSPAKLHPTGFHWEWLREDWTNFGGPGKEVGVFVSSASRQKRFFAFIILHHHWILEINIDFI